jgi:hypothetical protein
MTRSPTIYPKPHGLGPNNPPELGELGRLRAELNIIKDYGNMGEKGQANQSTGNIRASVQ